MIQKGDDQPAKSNEFNNPGLTSGGASATLPSRVGQAEASIHLEGDVPRQRILSPSFFKDEDMAECAVQAQLCFIGMLTLADREGRLEDRPRWIRAELFPYCDSVPMDDILVELSSPRNCSPGSFIQRYEVDGRKYIQICNFLKYQKPHPREAASKIPPCPEKARPAVKLHGEAKPRRPVSKTVPKTVPKTVEEPQHPKIHFNRNNRKFEGEDINNLNLHLSQSYSDEFGQDWVVRIGKKLVQWRIDNPKKQYKNEWKHILNWFRGHADDSRKLPSSGGTSQAAAYSKSEEAHFESQRGDDRELAIAACAKDGGHKLTHRRTHAFCPCGYVEQGILGCNETHRNKWDG
jgi:hypothetical protein